MIGGLGGGHDIIAYLGVHGTEQFDSQLSKAEAKANKTARIFDKVLKASIIAGGVAFIGATAKAAKFEKKMASVGTLLGNESAPQVEKMSDAVLELSTRIPQSSSVLSDTLYQIVSATVPASEAMEVLEISAEGAVAGVSDAESTFSLFSSVIKGYGMEWSEVGDISDKVFTTIELGSTKMEALAENMRMAIPFAATIGVEFNELAGATATLTGVTGNTSEVMTQLRSIMGAMVKPSGDMEDAFEALGVASGKELIEKFDGLQGALNALEGYTEDYNKSIGKVLGRKEALSAYFALQGDLAEDFTNKTRAMVGATGATEEAFRKQMDTFSNQAQALVSTMEAGLIDTGNQWLDNLTDTLKILNQYPGEIRGTTQGILTFTVAAGGASAAVKAFQAVSKLTMSTLGPWGLAIAGLVAAFVALKGVQDAQHESRLKNIQSMKDNIDQIKILEGKYNDLKGQEELTIEQHEKLDEITDELSQKYIDLGYTSEEALQIIGDGAEDAAEKMKEKLTSTIIELEEELEHIKGIQESGAGIWAPISESSKNLEERLKAAKDELEEFNGAQENSQDIAERLADLNIDTTDSIKAQIDKYEELREQIAEKNSPEYKELTERIKRLKEKLVAANTEVDNQTDFQEEMETAGIKTTAMIKDQIEKWEDYLERAKAEKDPLAIEQIQDRIDKLKTKIETPFEEWQRQINNVKSDNYEFGDSIKDMTDSFQRDPIDQFRGGIEELQSKIQPATHDLGIFKDENEAYEFALDKLKDPQQEQIDALEKAKLLYADSPEKVEVLDKAIGELEGGTEESNKSWASYADYLNTIIDQFPIAGDKAGLVKKGLNLITTAASGAFDPITLGIQAVGLAFEIFSPEPINRSLEEVQDMVSESYNKFNELDEGLSRVSDTIDSELIKSLEENTVQALEKMRTATGETLEKLREEYSQYVDDLEELLRIPDLSADTNAILEELDFLITESTKDFERFGEGWEPELFFDKISEGLDILNEIPKGSAAFEELGAKIYESFEALAMQSDEYDNAIEAAQAYRNHLLDLIAERREEIETAREQVRQSRRGTTANKEANQTLQDGRRDLAAYEDALENLGIVFENMEGQSEDSINSIRQEFDSWMGEAEGWEDKLADLAKFGIDLDTTEADEEFKQWQQTFEDYMSNLSPDSPAYKEAEAMLEGLRQQYEELTGETLGTSDATDENTDATQENTQAKQDNTEATDGAGEAQENQGNGLSRLTKLLQENGFAMADLADLMKKYQASYSDMEFEEFVGLMGDLNAAGIEQEDTVQGQIDSLESLAGRLEEGSYEYEQIMDKLDGLYNKLGQTNPYLSEHERRLQALSEAGIETRASVYDQIQTYEELADSLTEGTYEYDQVMDKLDGLYNKVGRTNPHLSEQERLFRALSDAGIDTTDSVQGQIDTLENLIPDLEEGSYEYQQLMDKLDGLYDKLGQTNPHLSEQERLMRRLSDAGIESKRTVQDQISTLEGLANGLEEGSYEYQQVMDKLDGLYDKLGQTNPYLSEQERILRDLKDAGVETTGQVVDQINNLQSLASNVQKGSYEYEQLMNKLAGLYEKLGITNPYLSEQERLLNELSDAGIETRSSVQGQITSLEGLAGKLREGSYEYDQVMDKLDGLYNKLGITNPYLSEQERLLRDLSDAGITTSDSVKDQIISLEQLLPRLDQGSYEYQQVLDKLDGLYGKLDITNPHLSEQERLLRQLSDAGIETAGSVEQEIQALESLLPKLEQGSYEYDQVIDKLGGLYDKLGQTNPYLSEQERLMQALSNAGIETTGSVESQIESLERLKTQVEGDSYALKQINDKIATLKDKLDDARFATKAFEIQWGNTWGSTFATYDQYMADMGTMNEDIQRLMDFDVNLETTDADEQLGQMILKMQAFLETLEPGSAAYEEFNEKLDEMTGKFVEMGGDLSNIELTVENEQALTTMGETEDESALMKETIEIDNEPETDIDNENSITALNDIEDQSAETETNVESNVPLFNIDIQPAVDVLNDISQQLDTLIQALYEINLGANDQATPIINEIETKTNEMPDRKLKLEINDETEEPVNKINDRIQEIPDKKMELGINDETEESVNKINDRIQEIPDKKMELGINDETEEPVNKINDRIQEIPDKEFDINIDNDPTGTIDSIQSNILGTPDKSFNIDIGYDPTWAIDQIQGNILETPNKEFDINIGHDPTWAIDQIQGNILGTPDKSFNIDIGNDPTWAIDQIQINIDEITDKTVDINLNDYISDNVDNIQDKLSDIDDKDVAIGLTDEITNSLATIQNNLDNVTDKDIAIDLTDNATSDLNEIVNKLEAMEEGYDVPINYHEGGDVPSNYHTGGEVSELPHFQKGGEVPAILHEGEYVIRENSANNIGLDTLNYMNQTGRFPNQNMNITVTPQIHVHEPGPNTWVEVTDNYVQRRIKENEYNTYGEE